MRRDRDATDLTFAVFRNLDDFDSRGGEVDVAGVQAEARGEDVAF